MEDTETYFPKIKLPYAIDDDGYVMGEVVDGFGWVFDRAEEVIAIEKIDGENLRVDIADDGKPKAMYRRNGYSTDESGTRVYNLDEIPLWDEAEYHYTEALVNAYRKGWMDHVNPGTHFGEIVGPKIQGNRYGLDEHYWVPFEYAMENLEVESYGKYDTDFESISDWFETNLLPLFYRKMNGGISFDKAREESEVEGLVFVLPEGDSYRDHKFAKLRRDDFKWYNE